MKFIITTLLTGAFLLLLSVSIAAQCPAGRFVSPNVVKEDGSNRKEGTIKYALPGNTKFYFKMDNSISSETYRAGDIVSFTVIEDIYGEFIDYKERTVDAGEKKEKISYAAKDSVKVISKNTKGYGRVNFTKRPTLFYARGKSKIYVVPQYIVLDTGQCIPIELPEVDPTALYFAENIKPCKYQPNAVSGDKQIRQTDETDKSKQGEKLVQCIQGRRPKVFNSGIVKAGAAGLLAALSDDNNSDRLSIGSLTVLNEGAGIDGIVDLLTGKNAEISSSLIFEAVLLSTGGYIEHPAKKEEKKD